MSMNLKALLLGLVAVALPLSAARPVKKDSDARYYQVEQIGQVIPGMAVSAQVTPPGKVKTGSAFDMGGFVWRDEPGDPWVYKKGSVTYGGTNGVKH